MSQRCEDVIMPFGKYKGETLGAILADNPAYLDWLADADFYSVTLAVAVADMCRKYAAEIDAAVEE